MKIESNELPKLIDHLFSLSLSFSLFIFFFLYINFTKNCKDKLINRTEINHSIQLIPNKQNRRMKRFATNCERRISGAIDGQRLLLLLLLFREIINQVVWNKLRSAQFHLTPFQEGNKNRTGR